MIIHQIDFDYISKHKIPAFFVEETFKLNNYKIMARHIHRRNIKFKNEIANADKRRILGVAIDPSKDFHRVIIFNFLGKIIGKPFSMDVLKKGFNLLLDKTARAQKRIAAEDVYIAIEAAGSYSENLVCHLQKNYKNVVLIPPTAVASNRKQQSLQGLKTDDIDCGAIGDLLIRGEFVSRAPETRLYYQLRNLIYWREKKLVLMCILKNQIADRLKKVYPGLNSDYGDDTKLYTHPERSVLYQGLQNNLLIGQQILKTSDRTLFDMFGYGTPSCGIQRIQSLKKRFDEMLLPDEDLAAIQIDILKRDVRLLRCVEEELKNVDQEIVDLGKLTPAQYIMGQIKGINDVYAAMYVGIIGDIRRYKSAKHIYSKSGLSPKTQQSGSSNLQSIGIKRAGNALLRSVLFKMASVAILCEPSFKEYHQRLKKEKKRHWKKNRIAVCRKLNNVLFALMRDKVGFRRIGATGKPSRDRGLEPEFFTGFL